MSYFQPETLNVGDACGVYEPTNYDGYWRRAIVVRLTKTTVTVEEEYGSSKRESTFMKNSNRMRGHIGSSWRSPRLVSAQEYEAHLLVARQKRADREQVGYRERMIEKLSKAVGQDETFRALLAELNNHEYV